MKATLNALLYGMILTGLIVTAGAATAAPIPKCDAEPIKVDSLYPPGKAPGPTVLAKELAAVLMDNEVGATRAAYCLSDAHMSSGKNGLSFGFYQLDLATNSAIAQRRLLAILEVVRHGSILDLNDEDLVFVKSGGLAARATVIRASNSAKLAEAIVHIDQALATKIAVSEINADYLDGIDATIRDSDDRISTLKSSPGKQLLQSDNTARIALLDYENFFGAIGSKFRSFLEGKAEKLAGGTIMLSGTPSAFDVVNFYLSTAQCKGPEQDHQPECLRRINNIFQEVESIEGPVALTASGKAYLLNELKPKVFDDSMSYVKSNRDSGQYKKLLELIKRAA